MEGVNTGDGYIEHVGLRVLRLLMQWVGCSASNVQVPEHVISDEAVSSNTAAQPSLLVPLDAVPGAGRQKTPTRSRRCNSSAPQRFTRAPVARTLLVSPNASPSRCTSPLQLRNDASPARCASPLQLRNVAGGGLGGATGKAGNCCRDPGFMAAMLSSLSQSNQYDKHRRGVRKRKPRGGHCKHKGRDKVHQVRTQGANIAARAKQHECCNRASRVAFGGRDRAFGPSDYFTWKSGRST